MNTDRFKFRVWDKVNERYLPTCDIAIDCDFRVYLWDREHDEWVWYSNDPLIEQCTGLKDKNGKLIYEGDIVTIYNPLTGAHDECRVAWENDSAGYVCLYLKKVRICSYNTTYLDGADCSVIGNIHEGERKNEN